MSYCTTQDVLDFDANAAYLTATPNDPDFTLIIDFVDEKINLILRNAYPGLATTDIEDVTQIKLIAIHGVLEHLYRNAVMAKGSSAQYIAETHRKEFESLLRTKIDLINGETIKPKQAYCLRG